MDDLLLERYSLKEDAEMKILLPEIKSEETQLLLIYEASEEMHHNNFRKSVVTFLDSKGAMDIKAYMNSSIYFKLKGRVSSKRLVELESEFRVFVETLQAIYEGKAFWIFNIIGRYNTERLGMVGKGNFSFMQRFLAWLEKVLS